MIGRRRAEVLPEAWQTYHAAVWLSAQAVQLADGNPARATPCPRCRQAAGPEPVHIAGVVLSAPCDGCGDHLVSCGFVVHARCVPVPQELLISAAMEITGTDARTLSGG